MKFLVYTAFLTCLIPIGCINAQTTDSFEFSYENAHPSAKLLMKEEFYWSPIEESGPFGSDDGWDAAYGFRKWRMENKTGSPVTYLDELIKYWDYPNIDYHEMDPAKIKIFISSKHINSAFLVGQDNAIIGTGFAQFVLEGRIDVDIKKLTMTAIERQLLPLLINRYDENYRNERKEQLTKMLKVINQINKNE